MSATNINRAEQIIRTCARAGQTSRAAACIASGLAPSKIEAMLKQEATARLQRASVGTSKAVASMKRILKAQGLEPKGDPGAGLPPAQASMARVIAQSGR